MVDTAIIFLFTGHYLLDIAQIVYFYPISSIQYIFLHFSQIVYKKKQFF